MDVSEDGRFSYYCPTCDTRIVKNTKEELEQINKICLVCSTEMEFQESETDNEEEEEEVEEELTERERALRDFSAAYHFSREKGKGKGKQIVEMDASPCPVRYEEEDPELQGNMSVREMVEFSLLVLNNGDENYFYSRTIEDRQEVFSVSLRWMAAVMRAARFGFDEKIQEGIGGFGLSASQVRLKRGFLETALSCIGECKKMNLENESCLWENTELNNFIRTFTAESNLRKLIDHIIGIAKINPKLKYPTYLPLYEPYGRNIYNQPINAEGEVIERDSDNRPKGKGYQGKDGKGSEKGKGKDEKGKGKGPEIGQQLDRNRELWPPIGNQNRERPPAWDRMGRERQQEPESMAEVKESITTMAEAVKKLIDLQASKNEPKVEPLPGFPDPKLVRNQADQQDPNGIKIQALEAGLMRTSQEIVEMKNQTQLVRQKMDMGFQNMEDMFSRMCIKIESIGNQPHQAADRPARPPAQTEPLPPPDPNKPKPFDIDSLQLKTFQGGPGVSSSSELTKDQLLGLQEWPAETIYLRQLLLLFKSCKMLDPQQEVNGLSVPLLVQLKDQLAQSYDQYFNTFPDFMAYVKKKYQAEFPALMNVDPHPEPNVIPKKFLQCVICLKWGSEQLEVSSGGGKCWASCAECKYERNIWPVYRSEDQNCLTCGEPNYLYTYSIRQTGVCFGCDTDPSRTKIGSIVKYPPGPTFYLKTKIGKGSMVIAKHEQVRQKLVNLKGEELSLEACPNNGLT